MQTPSKKWHEQMAKLEGEMIKSEGNFGIGSGVPNKSLDARSDLTELEAMLLPLATHYVDAKFNMTPKRGPYYKEELDPLFKEYNKPL